MSARVPRLLLAVVFFAVLATGLCLSQVVGAGFAANLSSPVSAGLNGGYLYGEVLTGSTYGHLGVDFSIAEGGSVCATSSGTVSFSGAALSVLNSGTAAGGGVDYIVLASSASPVDNAYLNAVAYVVGGAGAGQSRIITSYVGATRRANIASSYPWSPIPNTTSTYQVGTYTSYGEYVKVSHSSGSYFTVYAHLKKRLVLSGSGVAAGQQIGVSGATGNVTGPHLHFEVRKSADQASNVRNPESWLARSNQSPYGALRGKVTDSSGAALRQVRVYGASKPTDGGYGASYTYALNQYAGPGPFGDVADYGINYYIGRATSGSVTLTYTKTGYTTQTVGTVVDSGSDKLLGTVIMP